MLVTVWDTETTGFPVREGTLDQQPYIVQFAAITADIDEVGNMEEKNRYDFLINPCVTIPFGASQVHGIYDKDVVDAPKMWEKIDEIMKILNGSDIVVGHNVSYDEEVLGYELQRLDRMGDYTPAKSICTMHASTDHCKLSWRWVAYKPPKLAELHRFLFDEWFDGAHDAMVDVEATLRSFVALVKRQVIPLETSNTLRLF